MLKNYLINLKSACKKLLGKFPEPGIMDIILFGSSVKGELNPRDIDILILFLDAKLKDRAVVGQELKGLIGKGLDVDIKTLNLQELFSSEFLARQAIFLEGYSLLHEKNFSESLGFDGAIIFKYSLKKLNHNEKTKFTYSLIGRLNIGIVKELGGEFLGKGCVLIPISKSIIFEDFLKKWKVEYSLKKTLVSKI